MLYGYVGVPFNLAVVHRRLLSDSGFRASTDHRQDPYRGAGSSNSQVKCAPFFPISYSGTAPQREVTIRREHQVGSLRKRLAVVCGALTVFIVGGVVLAAWLVPGNGQGYSKASSAQALTTSDVSASTTAQLYPGGSGDVKVKIDNPNPFAVTVTKVEANGAVSSDKAACTDVGGDAAKATGVSFTTQNLNSGNVISANGSLTLTLSDAAAMTNASVNACQGAVFTIPVTFTASS